MKAHHFNDPPRMPGSGLTPEQLLAQAEPLAGNAGQVYVERGASRWRLLPRQGYVSRRILQAVQR